MQEIILTISDEEYFIMPQEPFYFSGLLCKSYKVGDLLLQFSDIDLNNFVSEINHPLDRVESYKTAISLYIEQCQSDLSKKIDPIIAGLMLNGIEEALLSITGEDKNELNIKLNQLFENYALLQIAIKQFANNQIDSQKLSSSILQMQHIEARYVLTDQNNILLALILSDIYSLMSIEMANIKSFKKVLKTCENCNKLFIPQKRIDEIYCDRIYKNNKSCKAFGYSNKEKNDPFKNTYTKARKTQHARIRYNSHIPDYKEKHFEPWRKAAEEARDYYKQINDIDGFRQWLNDNKNSF